MCLQSEERRGCMDGVKRPHCLMLLTREDKRFASYDLQISCCYKCLLPLGAPLSTVIVVWEKSVGSAVRSTGSSLAAVQLTVKQDISSLSELRFHRKPALGCLS